MLEVRIEKRLGAFQLHADFCADGTLGLLGASGSGKSVTLQCIAGILRPDCGRIVLNGRVLFDSERRICLPPQKRNVGYLFQQYALFPNMTVSQNIYAGVRSGSRQEKQAVVAQALQTFRLTEVRDQHPHSLSGGQAQRTALARMLVGKPELLLLDEPFSALDRHLGGTLAGELHSALASFSGDVLFVSHDRDEIRSFCPRICVLDHGNTEPVVPTHSIFHDPHTIAAAKLAGFRNLFPASLLPLLGIHMDSRCCVCIPETAVSLVSASDPDSVCCRVIWSRYENGVRLLELRPNGFPMNLSLCMRQMDNSTHKTDEEVWVQIDKNALFFLKYSA